MDILFRLIKDGKVVGYERHEYRVNTICIVHTKRIDGSPLFSNRINHSRAMGYIKHDRKDLWTGIDIDGVKVFERDRCLVTATQYMPNQSISLDEGDSYEGVVRYNDGSFEIIEQDGSGLCISQLIYDEADIELIGTEGVE